MPRSGGACTQWDSSFRARLRRKGLTIFLQVYRYKEEGARCARDAQEA